MEVRDGETGRARRLLSIAEYTSTRSSFVVLHRYFQVQQNKYNQFLKTIYLLKNSYFPFSFLLVTPSKESLAKKLGEHFCDKFYGKT